MSLKLYMDENVPRAIAFGLRKRGIDVLTVQEDQRSAEPPMDPKPHPNHREYVQTLRRMTPGQRAKKAMEMSDFGRRLLRQGLRKRFPKLSEEAFHRLYLERLAKCHNSNY